MMLTEVDRAVGPADPFTMFAIQALLSGESSDRVYGYALFGQRQAKNGTPGTACLRMPSSLISTPMPGASESVMKPFSTCGPL